MFLTFHGAARTVTGSMHLVEANGTKLLLDCGLYQGKRKEAFERNRRLPFDPTSIHAVILSHAHIDHSGNLPLLVKKGFRGRILATSATRDLCEWMLLDSAKIQEKDVEHVNEKRGRRGEAPFEPLYTTADAERCLEAFEGVPYGQRVSAAPGADLVFRDAGHMLGSAVTHLEIREGGRTVRLAFTGDVGRERMPILHDPTPPEEADVLICESTYGGRAHETEADLKSRLAEVIGKTHARGGKMLIPAFAVGRTQTIVYYLHQLAVERRIPPLPVFVDSPLAVNVTEVFRRHPECYDEETHRFLAGKTDAFGFHKLTYVRDAEASKALNDLPVPCLIIAASGMMESGRVLHHLKRIAPDPRSTILIVGFMAEHTLGRRVEERVPSIRVYGEEYPLRAEVLSISGFSGHADAREMVAFLGRLRKPPASTFLVHGEEPQARELAARLKERGFPRVEVPAPGERFEV
jgi:metallo-beta-lactamase family protein